MPTTVTAPRWIIGISGASGTIYARRLLQVIGTYLPHVKIDLVLSEGAIRVFLEEDQITLGRANTVETLIGTSAPQIALHHHRDTGAAIASGSHRAEGMVIIPCSMSTLAAVATGYADNLLRRAADVTLKEGRKLLIVPRETPLATHHLRHMLSLSERGVVIVPAMPGFYNQPSSIVELVDGVVMRILDQMGLEVELQPRWRAESGTTHSQQREELESVKVGKVS